MTCKCGQEMAEVKAPGHGMRRMQCACGRQSLPYSQAAKRKAAQLVKHAERAMQGPRATNWTRQRSRD